MNDMKKKIYVSPVTERVGIRTQSSMLTTSQSPWADAKPNTPDGGNLWTDDDPVSDDEDTNWAGYRKNMSIW